MRITDVRVTPIAIADPPLRNAAGLHAPYALRTIVEIIDDHGTYGLSEIPGNKAVNEALLEAREVLVGQDPFQLNHIMQKLQAHFVWKVL